MQIECWRFITVPKEKTGKVIKRIKINKKTVSIYFNDGQRLSISQEAYVSAYLYEGKEISKKELAQLDRITSVKKLSEYALSLLMKKHYTEWKMREKLYAKEATKQDVDYIIQRLKSIDLIDDKAYIEDYLGYAEEKGYGKNKIRQELLKKGIFDEDIEEIRFNEGEEKKKALALLPALEKKYAKYSYEQKKQHIYGALLARGFSSEVASSCLNNVSKMNEKDEQEKIKVDYQKIYQKYKNKYEGRELNDKVFQALRRKGYRVSDIKKEMGGHNYDF